MNKPSVKLAIIGTGRIGSILAENFTRGGFPVIIASRVFKKAENLCKKLGPLAQAMTTEEAVKNADILLPATWFDAIKHFVLQFSEELKGKILIDIANPIACDTEGKFKKTNCEAESSAELLLNLLPAGTTVIKAFGTLSATSLHTFAHRKKDPAVLFYTSSDRAANFLIETLIHYNGFMPFYAGDLSQSKHLEALGCLHELGGLGKILNAQEAGTLFNKQALK